jgi:hypothetical protein
MKTITGLILCIIFSCCSLKLTAQENKKPSIGFQFNPFLNEALFKGESLTLCYALRYNFSIKDHITLGPEVSGYYFNPKVKNPGEPYIGNNINIGGYFRYSFLTKSWIRPFVEISSYVALGFPSNKPENATPPVTVDPYISGYIAPGVTLFNKSEKFSLDLFYKFSKDSFVNNKLSIFTYRLNIKF